MKNRKRGTGTVDIAMRVSSLEEFQNHEDTNTCITCNIRRGSNLIIDDTSIYEYDSECLEKKQKEL